MIESKIQKVSYSTFVKDEELRGRITQCLVGSPSSASVTSALPYAINYFANEVITMLVTLDKKIVITGLPSSSGKAKIVNLSPKVLFDALLACQASNEAAQLRDVILAQPPEAPASTLVVEFTPDIMVWLKSEIEVLEKEAATPKTS